LRRIATFLGLALLLLMPRPGRADSPDLVELRAALANDSISVDERARRALEGAATIDRATQRLTQASERRALWSQVVGLMDEFLEKHPDVEIAPTLRFQAAVYRWAEGRSFADQAELSPADPRLRPGGMAALDDAIRRFRAIVIKPGDPSKVLAQNIRFRLAQAIADRSRVGTEPDPARLAMDREALAILDSSLKLPPLLPYVSLLRSELANRLGLFGQAQIEVELAEKLDPPPPMEALIEARIVALCGRTQYEEARKAIQAAKLGESFKQMLLLRVTLARRRDKPPGKERKEIDQEAFRLAEPFRGSKTVEGRRALMDLARTIDEPAADALPEIWDLLAEGYLRLGDAARAGRMVGKGSDRAESTGQAEKAAALRYKAGAYLFEATKFAEADRRLTQVIDLPGAPRDLKARAGMLRALARGRAIATRQPEASRASYLSALENQVKDFPDDPASGEARWLLGQIRITSGRLDDALSLWSGIKHGHPRWLESRLTIADRQREAIEAQRINRDSSAINTKMEVARQSLKVALDEADGGQEIVPLTLLLARLELTPDAGRANQAIEAADRVLKLAAQPEQHQQARLLKIVALAQANRAIEAEKAARGEIQTNPPASLLPLVRLLDRAASEADSETIRRRIGLITRLVTTRLIDRLDDLPEASRDEVHLHHARALLFSGDAAAARQEISAWGGPVTPIDDELLRELADLYQRLDAFVLAIDTERFRSSRLAPGSLPWFESQYGMALAYYRADRIKEARKLIDATAILHPDLGGGDLKIRFERLRQKIGEN